MFLDWLIRNTDWIATIILTIVFFIPIYKKFYLRLEPFLDRESKEIELINCGSQNKIIILSEDKQNFVFGIVNFFTGILRNWIIIFINSILFKCFVALILAGILGAIIYYPIAIFTDHVSYKTTALDFPDPLCNRKSYKKILIFIHGWNGDDEKTWLRFPKLVCSDERLKEFEAISINYPTYIENRHLRISELAVWIDESLSTRIPSLNDGEVNIIAHSMGGLLAKELVMLRKLSDSKAINKLVTIGSPHNGAVMANLLSSLTIEDEYIEDMTEGSVYLTGLHVRWNKMSSRPNLYCFSSPRDIVVKQSSAFFQCDTQFSYPQWSHSDMVKPANSSDDRYLFPIRHILDNS